MNTKKKNKVGIVSRENDAKYDNHKFTFQERFLKYITYDTQADMNSKSKPSTDKQKILLKQLMKELTELNIKSIYDDKGYVYAKIPSNTNKNVPPIAFIAHVDTNFDVSGKDVKAIIHDNYDGKDIILPKDSQVIRVKDNPTLKNVRGHTIITTDGSTLLGADDKAGVAEIMDAATYIMSHPEFKHGDICIAFTTHEEVGRGTEGFDVSKLGAKFAYTVDGENVGEVECETFNADRVRIEIKGHNTHTGYGKGKMVNAVRIASEFIEMMPKKNQTPETTSEYQGFIHVNSISGNVESVAIEILLRDFKETNLTKYAKFISDSIKKVVSKYPKARYSMTIEKQYRNMKSIVDKYPQVMEYAIRAMKNLNIKPEIKIIRGGTDGCNLSYMGLPTPNIFCGEHNFHSKTEWVSVQEMKLAVKTILEICTVWESES